MKNIKKNRNISSAGKIIAVFLLSFSVSLSPILSPKTHAWDAFAAALYKQTMEKLDFTLNGIIMTTLQQQAVRIINQQYAKLVGGTIGSGAMFITNWENFLVTAPERETNRYLNDYLSQLTRGRGSYSSYIPARTFYGTVYGASDSKAKEGFFGGKVLGETSCTSASDCSEDEDCIGGVCSSNGSSLASSGNYYENLLDSAKSTTTERKEPQITYEGDPNQMFASGNFRKFNLYLYPNTLNSEFAMGLVWAPYKQQQYLRSQERIAFAQSIAYQGYKGTVRNGQVITPGSLISQTMANVQDLGNRVIAAAQHPEQVISSIVANVITQSALMGIGAVSSIVDKQVNQVTDKVVNTVNGTLNQYGPSVLYNSGSRSSRY